MKHVPEERDVDRNVRECAARAGDVVLDVRRRGRLVVLVLSLLRTCHDLEHD